MPGRFIPDIRALPVRLVLALATVAIAALMTAGLATLWLIEAQTRLPAADRATLVSGLWIVLAASAVGLMAAAVVLGLFLARRITTPLQDLAAASESMGRGDLSTPVTYWYDVTEVTSLARTLERTRLRLHSAYQELAHAKEWSENLIGSLVEGVFTLDQEGRLTSFSPGAERISGWRATDVIGRSFSSVFESPAPLNSMPGTVTRHPFTTRDGRALALLITSGAMTAGGAMEQAFVLRDSTQEEEARRLREFFLANVSHELKTPLSSLRASVELLAADWQSLTLEEQSELINSLWLGTIRLEELVDNLLSSASIRSGHFQIAPRPTALGPVVKEAALTSKPLLSLRGQRLDINLDRNLPPVWGDSRRLNQVLMNLISNAGKYGPANAPISILGERRGDRVVLSVIDCGEAIPTERYGTLFQPFQPGDDVSAAGVGLGLSIVRTIVERLGGDTGVKRAPGGGNAFWFSMRIARGE
ncbi:MAG: ATP-binding protein [Rudaea sp.]